MGYTSTPGRKVLFRVFRDYFDRIEAGTKDFEARPATAYWSKIATGRPEQAVFLCGRRVHRRRIVNCWVTDQPCAAIMADPRLSSVFGGQKSVVFALGEAVA